MEPWECPPVPPNYWKDKKNRTKYFDWLGKKLKFISVEDWHKHLSTKTFKDNFGNGLLYKYYGGSKFRVLEELFPGHCINPWEIPPVPRNFWQDKRNRLKYLSWLGKKLDFQSEEDWYELSTNHFYKNNGSGLLVTYYKGSKINCVKELFPNYNWYQWLFGFTSNSFWKKKENRHDYMNWLGTKYQFKCKTDWYKISNKHFENLPKGESFLIYYNYSPIAAVKDFIPDFDWKDWLFEHPPKHFWSDINNIKNYFGWLEKKLGFARPDDWYQISQDDLKNNKGYSIIKQGQVNTILRAFPQYDLKPWKFKKLGNFFWQKKKNRRMYLLWLGEQLGYKETEDWYNSTVTDFIENFGLGILDYKKTYISAVIEVDENFSWDKSKFFKGLKNQKKLYQVLKKIYPNHEIIWNHKSDIRFSNSGKKIEIDIFLPELKIGFEYQGEQHYKPISIFGGKKEFEKTVKRDKEKMSLCTDADIKLYLVPYTWNGRLESLKVLINNQDR